MVARGYASNVRIIQCGIARSTFYFFRFLGCFGGVLAGGAPAVGVAQFDCLVNINLIYEGPGFFEEGADVGPSSSEENEETGRLDVAGVEWR